VNRLFYKISDKGSNGKIFGLEPSIYRTRGEHANHYATDAVTIEFTAILEFKLLGSVSRAYYIFGEVPNRDTVFFNIIDRIPGAK
jgi:hypothetical protein